MRTIHLIVVHCSATRAHCALTPEALETSHRRRGFRGIGYHYYIRKDGTTLLTRPLELIGAHAKGHKRPFDRHLLRRRPRRTGPSQRYPHPRTALGTAPAGAPVAEALPQQLRVRASRPESGHQRRRGDGARGVGEGMPVL